MASTNPPNETRAHKDARLESSINEHTHVLAELTKRMTIAEEKAVDEVNRNLAAIEANNRVSCEEVRKNFAEIKLLMTTMEAQHPDAPWSASGIFGSGSSFTRRTSTPPPVRMTSPTAALAHVAPPVAPSPPAVALTHAPAVEGQYFPAEAHGNSHAYRIRRLDFLRFFGASWLLQCEHYFETDGTSEDTKLKVAAIHLEGEALQWYQVFAKVQATEGKMLNWSGYVEKLKIRFSDDIRGPDVGNENL